jgi:hypothetical protein
MAKHPKPVIPSDRIDDLQYNENSKNARKFFKFIRSPTCRQIYKDFGFLPHIGG